MKEQKLTEFDRLKANALEDNIGNFCDPQLWEEIKKIHNGITKENTWKIRSDYMKALGRKGNCRWYGKFEVKWDYTDIFKTSRLYGGDFK